MGEARAPWSMLQGFGHPPVGALMAFAGQLGPPIPSTARPPDAGETGPHVTVALEAWGWMLCDGRTLSVGLYPELFEALGYLYGGSGESFRIPDYRGEFWRGVDGGRGVDPDTDIRTDAAGGKAKYSGIGSQQTSALQDHEHNYLCADATAAPAQSGDMAGAPSAKTKLTEKGPVSAVSSITVGVSKLETRPKNIAVNYIIKFTSGVEYRF